MEDEEIFERLKTLGYGELVPEGEISSETRTLLTRLAAELEELKELENQNSIGDVAETASQSFAKVESELRALLFTLGKHVDEEVLHSVAEEAASVVLGISENSKSDGGGSASVEVESQEANITARSEEVRRLQRILDTSQSFDTVRDVLGQSESFNILDELRPVVRTDSQKVSRQPQTDLEAILDRDLEDNDLQEQKAPPHTSDMAQAQAMRDLQDALEKEKKARELADEKLADVTRNLRLQEALLARLKGSEGVRKPDERERLDPVDRERKALKEENARMQDRIRQLEQETSVLADDVLDTDYDTKRAKKYLEKDDASFEDDLGQEVSQTSQEPIFTITAGDDTGSMERRLAIMEAANMVLQRDLHAAKVKQQSLKGQLRTSTEEKNNLESVILSLRQDLALAEMNCSRHADDCENLRVKMIAMEADLVKAKACKEECEAVRAALQSQVDDLTHRTDSYKTEIAKMANVEEERRTLAKECADLRARERELQRRSNAQTAALKELDHERSKLREYLVRYEKELEKNEEKIDKLKIEFRKRGFSMRSSRQQGADEAAYKQQIDMIAQLREERDRRQRAISHSELPEH